ncbi:MAG: hypothetical protein KTR16_00195 [Acidiferrobacterales bacterium]|nr:hypothetical protein [Acidiferrobacterales bacterium]
MPRQMEIDFFSVENSDGCIASANTDLFGSVVENEMHMEREQSDSTAKITADVSDDKSDIFANQSI